MRAARRWDERPGLDVRLKSLEQYRRGVTLEYAPARLQYVQQDRGEGSRVVIAARHA